MKYLVQSWVDYDASNSWEFDDRQESLEFYKTKVKNLSKERKEENQQRKVKMKDKETWGYTWYDCENDWEGLNNFKSWKEVKDED